MRLILGLALTTVLMIAVGSRADDKAEKIDGKKLIGKWDRTDGPKGIKIGLEFKEGGKAVMLLEADGEKETTNASYKLDGNKLSLTYSFMGKEKTHRCTVTKLAGDDLVVEPEAGKTQLFKWIKDK